MLGGFRNRPPTSKQLVINKKMQNEEPKNGRPTMERSKIDGLWLCPQ